MTISFFPFYFECLLFLFPAWLLWWGHSILCWIKVAGMGHPSFALALRRKAFSSSSLGMMLAAGLLHTIIIILWYVLCSLYSHFVESYFNHKLLLNVVKCFFCICWDVHVILILPFVNVVYISLTYLWMLNHPRIPGINSTW